MVINDPPSMAGMKDYLREFFTGMLDKLDRNSHKDTPNKSDIPTIMGLLRAELEEFEEQFLLDKNDENTLIELFDAANFAFLAFVALRKEGVKTSRDRVVDEFLSVDPALGKVYCKKTRAGSQYKVGQEIKGARRSGYVELKIQSALNHGKGLTIPRSHLVWRAATGNWPQGVLDHINRIKDDDRIENLRDVGFRENSLNHGRNRKYPKNFTAYMTSCREHLPHYGKFVYQRHHNGVNVRVAYYDTPEEASIQGEKDWLNKIKEMDE